VCVCVCVIPPDRFCPSVFIYLLCVVPAIWFLELHEMDKRIEKRLTTNLTSLREQMCAQADGRNLTAESDESEEELSADLGTVLGVSGKVVACVLVVVVVVVVGLGLVGGVSHGLLCVLSVC